MRSSSWWRALQRAVTSWWSGGTRGGEGISDTAMRRVTKKRAGRLLDGRTWDEMPGIGSARLSTEEG